MMKRLTSVACLLLLWMARNEAWAQLPTPSPELNSDYAQAEAPVAGVPMAEGYAAMPADGSIPDSINEPAGVMCDGSGNCPECNAGGGCGFCPPIADKCPRYVMNAFAGFDSFRGVADGTFQNNNGFVTGLNGGMPIPWLGEYGVGFQAGASYGVYDWDGRAVGTPATGSQTQVFATTGFFRRADSDLPIAAGIVHDWMFNTNFGTNANDPTLGQWRLQTGYLWNAWNEFGVWATFRDLGVHKTTATYNQGYRAVDQASLFWHHKFQKYGADGTFYGGLPTEHRLNQSAAAFAPAGSGGTLGSFIVGTMWNVPVNDRLSFYANGMYMKPSAHGGTEVGPGGAVAYASAQGFWDMQIGIAFYPWSTARSTTAAGRKWAPYMPMANNGNFMVDTNLTH